MTISPTLKPLTSRPLRCAQCMLQTRLCICGLIPSLECKSQLVLLMHHREIRKTTNTGALAARCIMGSELHLAGAKDQPLDHRKLVRDDASNLFLFPCEGAIPLTPAFCASLAKPPRLIVPDGDWGQATRLQRKLPRDLPLTKVALQNVPSSRYGLRRQANARVGGLATLEAIAAAFAIIEGPQISDALLDIFRTFVDRSLWSRGKLKAAHVHGGIPAESPFHA